MNVEQELTAWLDKRLALVTKTAVDEANQDLKADIDQQFAALHAKVDNLPGLITSTTANIAQQVGQVTANLVGLPTSIIQGVVNGIKGILPFPL